MNRKFTFFPFLLALLAALFFGAATPISKTLLGSLSAFQLAGLLYLGAALGVLLILLRERHFRFPWQMESTNLLRLLGAILFGGMLGPLALLFGLRLASAASISLWLNLEMVATAIIGHFFFRDHLTRRGWIAAGGVFLAASLLATGEGAAGLKAGALIAVAAFCWGVDNHLTALIDGITPAQSTFWKGIAAGTTNLLIGLSLAPLAASTPIVLGGLAVGMVSYGLSIALYITSAQNLGATRSQLIFSTSPFWGVLLSILFLHEPLTLVQIASAVLLAGSIALLFREQHQHRHEHQPLQHEHLHRHDDQHHTHRHPGEPASLLHAHEHTHQPKVHSHPHWPDLHHRHQHAE